MGMLHSAAQDFEFEAIDEGVTSQGQRCLLFTEKQANKISARCFDRWGWFPSVILSDEALPKAKAGRCWLAVDIPVSISPSKALNILFGLQPVESLGEAEAVLAWADQNPQALTNGQACRGVDQLRQLVDAGEI